MRVGLTGSIAVGKSFVTRVLAGLGCHVRDADQTAREVVASGTEGLRAVGGHFGPEVLQADGTLDRARLGALVFADAKKRAALNSILHPLIHRAHEVWLKSIEESDPAGIAVVDAALLIESGSYQMFDKIIVVHCQPDVQLDRLMLRNALTREEAERRVASQMPQDEKMRLADFLIDTSDGFEETRRQTAAVSEQLKTLAGAA
ncbi:MAG: dephospho-CoA kinase [Pyrinomonadaceae bacterium]